MSRSDSQPVTSDRSRGLKSRLDFSAATLKYIAAAAMLIDHIAAVLMSAYENYHFADLFKPGMTAGGYFYLFLRALGRTAFPIFAFLLVEGYFHTRNIGKYLLRLWVFALLSEVPFDLAFCHKLFSFQKQNVMFTLLLGLAAIFLLEKIRQRVQAGELFKRAFCFFAALLFVLLGFLLKTDYQGVGVALILFFYFMRSDRLWSCIVGYLTLISEVFSFPAFFLIYFYSGKKGKSCKYFFYLFYPLHLLVLVLIRWLKEGGAL